MYIYTYQRWEFVTQITLADLWEIYEFDLEYQELEIRK